MATAMQCTFILFISFAGLKYKSSQKTVGLAPQSSIQNLQKLKLILINHVFIRFYYYLCHRN